MNTAIICQGCGHPLRPVADGYVIDLSGDRLDALRPEMWGTPRLNGRIYCPPNAYALKVTGHVPVEPINVTVTTVGGAL